MIVDDSVVYRSQIRAALQMIPGLQIVGVFSSGKKSLEKISELKPDLMILDLEMPEMNGLEVLKEIYNRKINIATIVFSASSQKGAEITFEALRTGASDFVAKPSGETISNRAPDEVIKAILFPKIYALFPKIENTVTDTGFNKTLNSKTLGQWSDLMPEIIVIASSTGGPRVLEQILKQIKSPLNCPVVIVQHMPANFTLSFSQSLAKLTGLNVKEAQDGEVLEKNFIYLAPGDQHLTMVKYGSEIKLRTDQGELINSVRPAADKLFKTAAEIFENRCLGIVLSGMGQDGKAGAEQIKSKNGFVIIQEFSTCVVAGMPKAVFSSGAYDRIENPDVIARLINEKAYSKNSQKTPEAS